MGVSFRRFFARRVEASYKLFLYNNECTNFRQLDFSSQPGFANEILENEPKSCLTVEF